MYSYLKGIIIEAHTSFIILEVNGIGYKILIPIHLFGKLPSAGHSCFVYTSYITREFNVTLYGFLRKEERDVFEILQNVSGVGPKMALNLIGHLEISNLYQAIHHDSIDILCKVPGIGKKTAERLIIELRDKLQFIPEEFTVNSGNSALQKDAINALINLGYSLSLAQKAVKQSLSELANNVDLSTLITHSLKHVAR